MANYDLKWTNHAVKAFEVADKFRLEERFADVSILCDDLCIPAHRVVLASCSAYFDRIFGRIDASAGNCGRTAIVLKDVPSSLVRMAIEFMYAGEVLVPCEDFDAFATVAETLELRGLKMSSTAARLNSAQGTSRQPSRQPSRSASKPRVEQRSVLPRRAESVLGHATPSRTEQHRREERIMEKYRMDMALKEQSNRAVAQHQSDNVNGKPNLKRKKAADAVSTPKAKKVVPQTPVVKSKRPPVKSTPKLVRPPSPEVEEEVTTEHVETEEASAIEESEPTIPAASVEQDSEVDTAESGDEEEDEQEDREHTGSNSFREDDAYPPESVNFIPQGFSPGARAGPYIWWAVPLPGNDNCRGSLQFCSLCGYKTQHLNNASRHERTHTKETPFQCPYCDRAYGDISALYVHSSKVHKIKLARKSAASRKKKTAGKSKSSGKSTKGGTAS